MNDLNYLMLFLVDIPVQGTDDFKNAVADLVDLACFVSKKHHRLMFIYFYLIHYLQPISL